MKKSTQVQILNLSTCFLFLVTTTLVCLDAYQTTQLPAEDNSSELLIAEPQDVAEINSTVWR